MPSQAEAGAAMPMDLPATPRGERWITKALAAQRKGQTPQAMNMACSRWATLNPPRAILAKAGNGKPQWFIRTDADPALRDNPLPADIPVDTGALTETRRHEWCQRLAIVAEWQAEIVAANRASVPNSERLTQDDVTTLFLATLKSARGMDLSARTLTRWYRQSRSTKGAGGLIDGRWVKGTKGPVEDPFLAEAQRLYMARGGLSARYCCKLTRQTAREKGWKVWSDRKVAKYLASIPEGQRIEAREGRKAYTDKAETYINRTWEPVAANEQWNSDHHKLDLWVRTRELINPTTGEVTYKHERPWITIWQDNASRKIVGYDLFVGDPSTDNIILSFRRAVIAHGVPESVWVDNGKDYDSFALHGRTKRQRRQRGEGVNKQFIYGIFAGLQVQAHNVQKYHGQSKLAERFFGTMEGQFCRLFPDAYCGNKPDTRPEGLQKRLDAGKAPTLEELASAFAGWVENVYNAGEHTGEGMHGKSPNQVFAEKLSTIRTAPAELLDLLLLKHSKPVKVTQNGVRCHGFNYGQHADALRRMLGETVVVCFDPESPERVVVMTVAGKLVCGAESNQRLPGNATAAMMQAALKAKGHARKVELAYRDARLKLQETPLEIMIRMAAEKRASEAQRVANNPPPRPGMRPVRSPFEAEIPAIQRALKAPAFKRAAGAESLDLLALANAELDLLTPLSTRHRSSFSLLTALNDSPRDGDGGSHD